MIQRFNDGIQGSIADVRVEMVLSWVSLGLYAFTTGVFEGSVLASRLVLCLFAILEEYPSQMKVGHLVEFILGIHAL